jgi:hypothetical protein
MLLSTYLDTLELKHMNVVKGKGKGKATPVTGREGP